MLAVLTVRPRLCAEGPEAALQLRLDHIYAWEATADGNGFCLRLSEGDIQAGLLDRATFRMRPGEGVSVFTHHKSVLPIRLRDFGLANPKSIVAISAGAGGGAGAVRQAHARRRDAFRRRAILPVGV